jgi:hypothetical protein
MRNRAVQNEPGRSSELEGVLFSSCAGSMNCGHFSPLCNTALLNPTYVHHSGYALGKNRIHPTGMDQATHKSMPERYLKCRINADHMGVAPWVSSRWATV